MKGIISGFCAGTAHERCPGRIRNGLNVELGLDSKGNPTRTPKGPWAYCACKPCNHFPEERNG